VVRARRFRWSNSKEYIEKWEKLYGKLVYQGAWNFAVGHAVHGGRWRIPPMPEGSPTVKASNENAANFLVRNGEEISAPSDDLCSGTDDRFWRWP